MEKQARNSVAESQVQTSLPSKVGICLSGGGIRSAAFCLGAMQALQADRQLLRGEHCAALLSAVSGGSYSAAAYMLTAGGPLATPSIPPIIDSEELLSELKEARQTPDGHPLPDDIKVTPSAPFFKLLGQNAKKIVMEQREDLWRSIELDDPLVPGSPESNFIRRHARYMTEPGGPALSIVLLLVLVLVSLLFVLGFAGWLGAAVGLLSRWIDNPNFDPNRSRFELATWNVAGAVAIVGLAVWLYGFVLPRISRDESRRRRSEVFAESDIGLRELSGILIFTVILVLGGQFAPEALWHFGGNQTASSALGFLAAGLGGLATLGPALIGLSRSRRLELPKSLVRRSTKLLNIATAVGFRLLQVLVSLLVPAVLVFTFYAGWIFAIASDGIKAPLLTLVGGLVVFGYFQLLGGLHNMTPYPVYRARLSRCFDLIRQQRDKPTNPEKTEFRHEERARQRLITPRLSALRDVSGIPELLICASGNVTEAGATAAGSQAQAVIFSPKVVELPGIPGASLDTAELEESLSRPWRPLPRFDGSVMSCVAVAGAAVSPSMGKFTRSWLRSLMTLLNLRLGAWIPNPACSETRSRVTELATNKGRRMKPGMSLRYYLREMRGRHYIQAKFLYVSDGGHLENLGLLELLRRECTEVWCIDASGDHPGSALTLAETLTLVSGELGLEVVIDLSPFEIDEGSSETGNPLIRAVFTRGIVSGVAPDTYCCVVNIVKIGVDHDTSTRIIEMRRRYKRFPYDSTLNQLYNAERFDLYKDLGFESTRRAIAELSQYPHPAPSA